MVGTMGFAQTDSYLNVRASGDTDGEVIGKVYNNGSVEILDVDDNGWYYIKSGNVEGYVAGQYVATGGTAEKIAEDTGYTTAEVGADILNVRRDPSEDSDVVDTVSSSNHLEVVEDDGDWVKVVTDAGIYGYVSTDYVNVTTDYATGETVEEEQERLNKEWLEYLAQQEAAAQAAAASQAVADASYTDSSYTDTSSADQAYSEAQAAADAAAAEAQAQADAAAQAQAEADAAAAQAQAAQDAAAQAASTDVDSMYQAYLTAQSAADEAVANGSDADTINATAQAAQDAYAVYVEAQNQADAAAQAAADAQAQADAAAQAHRPKRRRQRRRILLPEALLQDPLSEHRLLPMQHSLSGTRMYGADPVLPAVLTAPDLPWPYIHSLVFPFRTARRHSQDTARM